MNCRITNVYMCPSTKLVIVSSFAAGFSAACCAFHLVRDTSTTFPTIDNLSLDKAEESIFQTSSSSILSLRRPDTSDKYARPICPSPGRERERGGVGGACNVYLRSERFSGKRDRCTTIPYTYYVCRDANRVQAQQSPKAKLV